MWENMWKPSTMRTLPTPILGADSRQRDNVGTCCMLSGQFQRIAEPVSAQLPLVSTQNLLQGNAPCLSHRLLHPSPYSKSAREQRYETLPEKQRWYLTAFIPFVVKTWTDLRYLRQAHLHTVEKTPQSSWEMSMRGNPTKLPVHLLYPTPIMAQTLEDR